MNKTVTLAMGNGGEENNQLIRKVFYKAFKNDILEKSEDAAILELNQKNIAMSTDSFTVSPIFFPGSDIGKLSICGTCNDLAMMGAKPKYLTVSFVIEEGFLMDDLEKIAKSMEKELEINSTLVVSGDTKVMPKGTVDKIIINTTGIGEVLQNDISSNAISKDDVIIVSRDIGSHGAAIFASREGIELESELKSDCTSLFPIVKALLDEGLKITALRDATRGGVSAVLNEWAKQSNVCIEAYEEKIPVSDEVKGICEILGFEPTALANEGTFLIAVNKANIEQTIKILKRFNKNCSYIADITDKYIGKVVLHNSWGTKRFLESPTGELLPRIC